MEVQMLVSDMFDSLLQFSLIYRLRIQHARWHIHLKAPQGFWAQSIQVSHHCGGSKGSLVMLYITDQIYPAGV